MFTPRACSLSIPSISIYKGNGKSPSNSPSWTNECHLNKHQSSLFPLHTFSVRPFRCLFLIYTVQVPHLVVCPLISFAPSSGASLQLVKASAYEVEVQGGTRRRVLEQRLREGILRTRWSVFDRWSAAHHATAHHATKPRLDLVICVDQLRKYLWTHSSYRVHNAKAIKHHKGYPPLAKIWWQDSIYDIYNTEIVKYWFSFSLDCFWCVAVFALHCLYPSLTTIWSRNRKPCH